MTLLVAGGLVIAALTLGKLGAGHGIAAGWHHLIGTIPDHFHMILKPGNPHYADLPGLSVLIGGMWIANLSYWGFNQYIIQRALAAKSTDEAQRGMLFAAFLKLVTPVIIVVPGIAAVMLAPDLPKARRRLSDDDGAAADRSPRSGVRRADRRDHRLHRNPRINSIATIFTLDVYAKARRQPTAVEDDEGGHGARERHLVLVGRVTAIVAIIIAILTARPLVGSSEQAFQFIPGIYRLLHPGDHRHLPARPCSGSARTKPVRSPLPSYPSSCRGCSSSSGRRCRS